MTSRWTRRGLSAAAALLLAACQGSSQGLPVAAPPPSELRVGIAELPASSDPALTRVYEGAAVRAVSEPLLRPRADLAELLPAAADHFEIAADGRSYSFHIRPAARWSDGAPVRADEFVAAWRRILDPRVNSPWGDLLAGRVRNAASYGDLDPVRDAGQIPAFLAGLGLRSAGESTFVVDLENPAPDFPWLAAMPELGPMRDEGGTRGAGARPGNGPFHIQSWSAQRVVLAANQHYWAGRPRLDRLILSPITAGEEVSEFKHGHQDLVNLSPAGVETLRREGEQDRELVRDVLKATRLTQVWLQFNVHEAPFDNPHVRLAVARSIDREALVTDVLKGAGVPSVGLIPRGLADSRPELLAQRFDPAAARSELAGAGLPAAGLPPVKLLVRDLPGDRRLGEFVAGQVRDHLGLDMTIEVVPSSEVTRRLATGHFQVQGPAGWAGDYPDERNWMDLFLTDRFAQWTRYRSAAYDRLVDLGDREVDPIRRRQPYLQAQQLLAEEAPVAFLFQAQEIALRQPFVQGLRSSPLDAWPGDGAAGEISIARH